MESLPSTITHSFLGPYSYHEQHAPVSDIVVEVRVILGLYLEVAVMTDKDGNTRLEMQHSLPVARIALAQEYCLASPSEYIGNDWIIGFPLL